MTNERRLDVSDLAAPEPLVESIRALGSLRPGEWLHLYHRMKPCKLYDFMHKQGFKSITCEGETIACEVFIWRDGDDKASESATSAASKLIPWND